MNTSPTSLVADTSPLLAPTLTQPGVARRSGLAGLILQAAIILPFIVLIALSASLPSHLARRMEDAGPLIPVALLGISCIVGGALWARRLARIVGVSEPKRLGWAGAIVYAPSLIAAVFLLNEGEKYFVEGPGQALMPVHVAFAILFTLAAAIVTALLGGALGIARRSGRLAAKLALFGGATAGLTFLAADIVQHLLGRHVGGPNAAATATMLTVMLVGNILAAVAASAVIGALLKRHVNAQTNS
jgi:hypothetical protein